MGFGLIYLVVEDLSKKKLNKVIGEIHFWLTIFGGFGFAFLLTVIGIEGAIRREANMPPAFDWAMPILLFFALCIGIAQFVFAYNLVATLRKYNPKIANIMHVLKKPKTQIQNID